MNAITVLKMPSLSGDAGVRAAYLHLGDVVVLLAGAGAWTFPSEGWRLADLERMADALSVILSGDAALVLQRRCAATPARLGTNTIVVQEPLCEKHLMPLIEAGAMTAMNALRALAWTKLQP